MGVYYDINFKVFVGGLSTTGTFRFVNPIRAATRVKEMQFNVFATKGTMSLTSTKAEVVFDFASNILYTLNVDYGNLGETYNGDISCSHTEYVGDSWDACKTRDINGACTETNT